MHVLFMQISASASNCSPGSDRTFWQKAVGLICAGIQTVRSEPSLWVELGISRKKCITIFHDTVCPILYCIKILLVFYDRISPIRYCIRYFNTDVFFFFFFFPAILSRYHVSDTILYQDTLSLLVFQRYYHAIMSPIQYCIYCAFDIFQKVVFCLTLYTEEVDLQIFVMI